MIKHSSRRKRFSSGLSSDICACKQQAGDDKQQAATDHQNKTKKHKLVSKIQAGQACSFNNQDEKPKDSLEKHECISIQTTIHRRMLGTISSEKLQASNNPVFPETLHATLNDPQTVFSQELFTNWRWSHWKTVDFVVIFQHWSPAA